MVQHGFQPHAGTDSRDQVLLEIVEKGGLLGRTSRGRWALEVLKGFCVLLVRF